ncbi:hypothetical protein C8F04DRAFT_1111736 [Mycena alexandri]|uniref:Uncharacterized protein n=1 Tax=Mycena alexandri TaxID=1745969 RepID=A0AAD6SNT5_9AGAR|nr:hypothetical protein C8F04DRAFT_1111736 [Mycena alexandri]
MNPRSLSLALFPCLCETVAALSVHTDSLFSSPVRGVALDDGRQGKMGLDLQPSTILLKRTAQLDRSITISIIVGVVGGVAMVVALILGLVLVLRKRRERQKIRDLARSAAKSPLQFTSPDNPLPAPADTLVPASKEHPYAYQHVPLVSPPDPESRRFTNLQSAWFLDEEERRRSAQTMTSGVASVGEETVAIGTFGPKNEQSYSTNSKPPPPDPTSIPHRSESLLVHGRTKSSTQTLPSPLLQPIHESQPGTGQPSGFVSPRPRGSSLGGSRPHPIKPPPAAGRHLASVSEDIRPVSRFSVSPVARSFPSRLTLSPTSRSSPSRHTRLRGIGSLSSLVKSPTSDVDNATHV